MCTPPIRPAFAHLAAVIAMHSESKFAQAYGEGIHKSKYWEYMLDDSLDLIAKLPVVAAMIYRNVFKDGAIGMHAQADVANKTGIVLSASHNNIYVYIHVYFETIISRATMGRSVCVASCHADAAVGL